MEQLLTFIWIFTGDTGCNNVTPWLRFMSWVFKVDWRVAPRWFTKVKSNIFDRTQRQTHSNLKKIDGHEHKNYKLQVTKKDKSTFKIPVAEQLEDWHRRPFQCKDVPLADAGSTPGSKSYHLCCTGTQQYQRSHNQPFLQVSQQPKKDEKKYKQKKNYTHKNIHGNKQIAK